VNWSNIKHFSPEEFQCSHCGVEQMDEDFMLRLDLVRDTCGFPIIITSGYRCPKHPIEAAKPGGPGPHSTGKAADLGISFHRARALLTMVTQNFNGLGIKQHGDSAGRFIHVDLLEPRLWTYK
jgi:uncharacterized protein YcbK (DUF882 family)